MGAEIFQATNYNSSHTDSQYVTGLYGAFLQRAPDGPGLSFWQQKVQNEGRAAALLGFQLSVEFGQLASTLYRETFWLVSDHLGVPRMVVYKTGSLAGVKRHDYLPFGEELSTNQGGRTPQQGYGAIDNVRQKFTSKERDDETGLDFFVARYYASGQGRFVSPDPLLASRATGSPQSWNRYSYVLNNPLRYIDPTGLAPADPLVGSEGTAPGNGATQQQQQTPPPPPPAPAQCTTVNILYQTSPPELLFSVPLPNNGGFWTGVGSVNLIAVIDTQGRVIRNGVTLKETVTPDGQVTDAGTDQNPHEVAPYSNGTFVDIVGEGKTMEKPFDMNNPKDVQAATDIIGSALSTAINKVSTQKLDFKIDGCGVVTVTDTQTISNTDPKTGKVNSYRDSQGNLTPNFNNKVEAKSGPITVRADPRRK